MKKISLFLISIISVLLPMGLVLSCSSNTKIGDNTYRGPNGGTFHYSKSGNKEYFGHNGHSGDANLGVIIGIIVAFAVLVIILILIFSAKSNTPHYAKKSIPKQRNSIQNKGFWNGRDWIGDQKWNGIGIPLKIHSIGELKKYTVALTGDFGKYTKDELIVKLKSMGININKSRKGELTNLWLLGKEGTLGEVKVNSIKKFDRIVKIEWLNYAFSNQSAHEKKYGQNNVKKTAKAVEFNEERELIHKICAGCGNEFKTYIEDRKICRTCKRLASK